MKRLIPFLLFALPALAQTPVTVTGLITDAGNNPATSGYVQFDITPKSSSIHYFIAGVGTITQTTQCGIDGTGHVKLQSNLANPCTVWGNDLINPGNTTYKVTFAPNGVITNIVSGELIVLSTYSLNSPVFAPIVQISPQQGIIRSNPFQTNILPIAGHTFNIGSPSLTYAAAYIDNLFLGGTSFSGANVAFLNAVNNFTNVNNFSLVPNFPSQSSSTFFASPCGSPGIPLFRAICLGDLPVLSLTGTGVNSSSTTSGHLAVFASNNGPLADGGPPGTGAVTNFSYSETGLDPLDTCTVTNPSTTPNLNCLAQLVPPGVILAGPVPTATGANPSFENSFINNVLSSTTLTITGAPLVSASSALVYSMNDIGAVASVVPTGFSTIENGSSWQLYTKTVASTASISPTVTLSGATNQYGNLFFLGGNINATPVHTALSGALTCSTGDLCASITPGSAVSASNILIITADFTGNIAGTATISDQFGNAYLKVGAGITGGGAKSGEVWLVQTPVAGTPTIVIDSHQGNFGISACCKMYELSGATPYFVGLNGPWTFRPPSSTDLLSIISPTNVSFFNTTLTTDLAVSATTITAICPSANCTDPAITMPTSGCPCRVFISYSMFINTGTSGVGWNTWLTDGTATWGQISNGQSNGTAGGLITSAWNGLSTVTYANSQTVTFTLNTFGDHTYTVKSQSPVSGTLGNGPVLSSMQISIQTSK